MYFLLTLFAKIIVTAAVHQILDPSLPLTRSAEVLNYWHWAGVSPYTSSFELAGTCVFVKQSLSVFCCNPALRRDRTSPKGYVQLSLPSSLRIVLSIVCVYSTRPPVSVLGTVKIILHHESFPGNRKIWTYVITTHINIPTHLTVNTCLLLKPSIEVRGWKWEMWLWSVRCDYLTSHIIISLLTSNLPPLTGLHSSHFVHPWWYCAFWINSKRKYLSE